MKKKIILGMLVAVLAVSAAACGDGAKKENNAADTQADKDSEGGTKSAAATIEYKVQDCVKLGDYSSLSVSLANSYEVTKEQIEDYANNMAQYNAKPVYKDTDKKKIEDGDTVNIDYEGKKDGVAFENGSDKGYNLTIGSNSFIDGFEEGLVGKKVGQTVDLDLTFPENYPAEDLAGEAVVFTVKINKIVVEDKDAKFELNDKFVQENFNCETVKEYKQKVKEYLVTTNNSNKETDTRQAVINKLLEVSEVTLPDGLLDARVEDYITQFTAKNCSDGTSLADFLSANFNGMTEEDFHTDITNEMQGTLNTELLLEAIADKEGIELDEDGYKEYVDRQMQANSYANEEEFYKANGVDAASGEEYERKVYVCNKALDLVIDKAKIEYGVAPEDSGENK